jgi:DNA repair exonuclease SbcCD ATPase subunit
LENENNNGSVLLPQVEQLRADLEAEKVKAATAIEEATKPLTDRITSLEQDLQTKDVELTTTRTQLSEKDTGFASLAADRDGAITAYKELVQKSNPVIPAEMITGASVTDINASLEKANALVNQIKAKVEADKTNNSIPAGAPGRTEPDITAMSTREKINYGLQKAKKGS